MEAILSDPPKKNPAAVELGRLGGLKGGPARAEGMTPEQRSESARSAAKARWSLPVLQPAPPEPPGRLRNRAKHGYGSLRGRTSAQLIDMSDWSANGWRVVRRDLEKRPGAWWEVVHEACGTTRLIQGGQLRERPPQRCLTCQPAMSPEGRDTRRSRRKHEQRATTISVKRMTKRELEIGRLLYPDRGERRPATRGECVDGQRPCPFVSCKHHLFVDVSPRTGAIKLNFPDLEPDDLIETCVLDVADRGGATLEDVGAFINVTRERVRQIEILAFGRLEPQREEFGEDDEDRVPTRVHHYDPEPEDEPESDTDEEDDEC